jgi:hypothetical protein
MEGLGATRQPVDSGSTKPVFSTMETPLESRTANAGPECVGPAHAMEVIQEMQRAVETVGRIRRRSGVDIP